MLDHGAFVTISSPFLPDHIAHIIELLGPLPSQFAHSGRNSKRYFNHKGKIPTVSRAVTLKWPPTFTLRRTITPHRQAAAVELIGDPAGQVRVASGGGLPVQLLPADHVGAAAREKSHGRPVSETPLDHLLDTDVQTSASANRDLRPAAFPIDFACFYFLPLLYFHDAFILNKDESFYCSFFTPWLPIKK